MVEQWTGNPKALAQSGRAQVVEQWTGNPKALAQVVEQWTGNPKAAGSIPVGRQFFALLLLSSRHSGGSSLGFRAGSL